MSLITDLKSRPALMDGSSRLTSLNGLVYLGAGSMLLAWPGAVQTLFRDPEFAGREASLVRIIGLTVAVIGWLYVFGGRSGGRQFAASTVVDRLLVPAVLVPLAMAGIFPHLLLTFAVLDPLLAVITWWRMAGETRRRAVS